MTTQSRKIKTWLLATLPIGAMPAIVSCDYIFACATDAQCNDGVYCNGVEVCRSTGFASGFSGPRSCRAARSVPCCSVGTPIEYSCDEICIESERTCAVKDDCVTDDECDDGILCNVDYCADGICFSRGTATQTLNGFSWDIDACRQACEAAGFGRVGQFREQFSCSCTHADSPNCNRLVPFLDFNGEGCDSVCDLAGWSSSQGTNPGFHNSCACGPPLGSP